MALAEGIDLESDIRNITIPFDFSSMHSLSPSRLIALEENIEFYISEKSKISVRSHRRSNDHLRMLNQTIHLDEEVKASKLIVIGNSAEGNFQDYVKLNVLGARSVVLNINLTWCLATEAFFEDRIVAFRSANGHIMSVKWWCLTLDIGQRGFPIQSIEFSYNPFMNIYFLGAI